MVRPMAVITVVARPMAKAARVMFTSIKAKPTPTTMESMLVAKAVMMVISQWLVLAAGWPFSSWLKLSRIILMPNAPSRIKASQWSHALIKDLATLPSSQPITGVAASTAPKIRAESKMQCGGMRCDAPLASATAKASIDILKASKMRA